MNACANGGGEMEVGIGLPNTVPNTEGKLLAKQAASLDRLSGGRLVLGLGLGGRDDDFTASGLTPTRRGRRLEEQMGEMKRIWSGEERGYAGPIGPALIIGGTTEASFR